MWASFCQLIFNNMIGTMQVLPCWVLAVLADEASRRMSLSSLSQDITLDPKFIEGPIDVESKF